MLTLTPRERRTLGDLTAGSEQQFAAIELGRQADDVTMQLAEGITKLRRRVLATESASSVSLQDRLPRG